MPDIQCEAKPMSPVAPPEPPMPLAEAATKPISDASPVDGTNLSMVLDVELNVLLRFGQRQLSLKEILDLTCGSVIELDRRVDDPVELLLDGRVIARGEAAIVDGNYGLRVTEIVQPPSSGQFPY
ncbi:MAG TPA: FliM/FliN family flagellar motor switch protein [Terracidiphilus sp.]|nr:FliM/FliN family flagellar motor switch protein [Terracidiphilus sp.]